MDVLGKKERELERKKLEHEIANENASIAERQAYEKEMKAKHGFDWKKILSMQGMGGKGVILSEDKKQDMYAMNPELAELSSPKHLRKL